MTFKQIFCKCGHMEREHVGKFENGKTGWCIQCGGIRTGHDSRIAKCAYFQEKQNQGA